MKWQLWLPAALLRQLCAAGATFGLALKGAPALAQSGTDAESSNDAPEQGRSAREQERSALYHEGVEMAEQGRWSEALQKFQSVVALRSAPAALIALGTAQEKLALVASARRTYARAHDDALAIHDQALAEKAALKFAALQARVPHLTIRMADKDAVPSVTIDSERVEVPAEGIEIDPGDHRVVVTVAGQQPYEQRARIAEGEKKELWVDFGRATKAGSKGPPTGPIILGSAGLVATVAGAVVYFNARSTYNDAQWNLTTGCAGDLHCQEEAVRRGNDARTPALLGSIVALTGVASIAGAGLWWALSASAPRAEPLGATKPLDVSVGATKGGGLIRWTSAF
jgi:hypothetical protein